MDWTGGLDWPGTINFKQARSRARETERMRGAVNVQQAQYYSTSMC